MCHGLETVEDPNAREEADIIQKVIYFRRRYKAKQITRTQDRNMWSKQNGPARGKGTKTRLYIHRGPDLEAPREDLL